MGSKNHIITEKSIKSTSSRMPADVFAASTQAASFAWMASQAAAAVSDGSPKAKDTEYLEINFPGAKMPSIQARNLN